MGLERIFPWWRISQTIQQSHLLLFLATFCYLCAFGSKAEKELAGIYAFCAAMFSLGVDLLNGFSSIHRQYCYIVYIKAQPRSHRGILWQCNSSGLLSDCLYKGHWNVRRLLETRLSTQTRVTSPMYRRILPPFTPCRGPCMVTYKGGGPTNKYQIYFIA